MDSFINKKFDNLDETMFVNSRINLYEDDYAALSSEERTKVDSTGHMSVFCSYKEAALCDDHSITCARWSPFMSGMIFVAYQNNLYNEVIEGVPISTEARRASYGCSPVILWSYDDSLSPKLLLESPRDVTYIRPSFVDPNILFGGCINGQVVIWDIENKIEQVESVEILTPKQQNYREAMFSLSKWWKRVDNPKVVKPAMISDPKYSHSEKINSIVVVNPQAEISRNGKYQDISDPDTEYSQQYLTSSLDGTLLVWDILISPADDKQIKPARKIKRLAKKPSALTQHVSKYKAWGRYFKPIFKIVANSADKPMLVGGIANTIDQLIYVPKGPNEDLVTLNKRAFFKLADEQPEIKIVPNVIYTTIGEINELKWDGFDYTPGRDIISQVAQLTKFETIHDGPVRNCHLHPTMMNLLLTVGGTIFACWIVGKECLSRPLLWRKCKRGCKYITGAWSGENVIYIILVRSDGIFELWDVFTTECGPVREVSLGGETIENIFGCVTPKHPRKKTYAVSDSRANLVILKIPQILDNYNKEAAGKYIPLFKMHLKSRRYYLNWMKEFQETHVVEQKLEETENEVKAADHEPDLNIIDTSELNKMNRIFEEVHWDTLQEKVMYQTLLRRKKLNLAEMRVQKIPLQKLAEEKIERQKKLVVALSNKNRLFEQAKLKLLGESASSKLRWYSLPHIIEEDMYSYLKDYEEIENRALNYIMLNEYDTRITWPNLIKGAKDRRKTIMKSAQHYNIRMRRREKKRSETQMYEGEFDETHTTSTFPFCISVGSLDFEDLEQPISTLL